MIATLKQKGKIFNWKISSTPKNLPNERNATELLDDLCELSMARTVARLVSGNSYGRGAATAVEPEATTSASLGRTKCVQNHENPPQMWHKSTISHGKKPC